MGWNLEDAGPHRKVPLRGDRYAKRVRGDIELRKVRKDSQALAVGGLRKPVDRFYCAGCVAAGAVVARFVVEDFLDFSFVGVTGFFGFAPGGVTGFSPEARSRALRIRAVAVAAGLYPTMPSAECRAGVVR
jgi:hypothetical protein